MWQHKILYCNRENNFFSLWLFQLWWLYIFSYIHSKLIVQRFNVMDLLIKFLWIFFWYIFKISNVLFLIFKFCIFWNISFYLLNIIWSFYFRGASISWTNIFYIDDWYFFWLKFWCFQIILWLLFFQKIYYIILNISRGILYIFLFRRIRHKWQIRFIFSLILSRF